MFAPSPAMARLTIWDIALGAHAANIPTHEFMEFACGSNGGPPLRPLSGFVDFAQCSPEASGLYEVQFRYDDEDEYWAWAHRAEFQYELVAGTKDSGYAVIVSVLFNAAGIVHGLRMVSDPRVVPIELRERSHDLRNYLLVRFDPVGWTCEDLPIDEGFKPLVGPLINQKCAKTHGGTKNVEVITHHFRKPGQFYRDPITNVITEGQFESSVHVEIVRNSPVDAPGDPARPDQAEAADLVALRLPQHQGQVPEDVAAFLRGETLDCPGCDLTGAVLKRVDLSGANLAGALLVGANLHNARLGGANLQGADLTGANLNRVRAERANFSNAIMTGTMGFASHFDGADLSGARMEDTRYGNAKLIGTNLAGAIIVNADFYGIRAAFADFTGAKLERVVLAYGRMSRAILTQADVLDSTFASTNLIGADLSNAKLIRTDFINAQLNEANLAGANLTESRLLSANVAGADMAGVVFSQTIMMNGDIRTDGE